jgi:hypothetical protein
VTTQPSDEKAKRQAARALLATYHEAKLADLLEHVRKGFTEYADGRIDAFALDSIIYQYSRAAKELWKFCSVSGSQGQTAAWTLERWRESGEEPDWWQEAEPARR